MATAKKTLPPRVKFDPKAGYKTLVEEAQTAANDRFSAAARILEDKPSALSTKPEVSIAHRDAPMFDVRSCQVGKVYSIPLALIDPNPVGVRHFYRLENTEAVLNSLLDSEQKVAVNGFVKGDRIELIDGGTRLRAARSAGLATLDVKIEEPPATLREQFKRSSEFHDARSDHTALDIAVNMRRLLAEGMYASQDELAADMEGASGKPMLKSQVSSYLRIARIPERLLQKMSENDQTSAFTIAYEISSIFADSRFEANKEEYLQIAGDVIDEVKSKQLSKLQTQALISVKLKGPKKRNSSVSSVVRYGEKSGTIKVFPSRGQLDFSIKDLSAEQVEDLQERIVKALSGQMSL